VILVTCFLSIDFIFVFGYVGMLFLSLPGCNLAITNSQVQYTIIVVILHRRLLDGNIYKLWDLEMLMLVRLPIEV
jgi:hypothetical protein